MSADTDYDGISYVVSSRYRSMTVDHLGGTPAATPSSIAEATGAGIAHISRALQELREKGYVELLVSEQKKKGRLYGLTEDGEAIRESGVYEANREAADA